MKDRSEYYLEYARRNKERRREINRKSAARPEYRIHRKEYQKKWVAENPEKIKANRKKWTERHRARDKFKYAVKSGKIVRMPCEICGDPKSEGHHEDYSKPFEVKWLCLKHHAMESRLS